MKNTKNVVATSVKYAQSFANTLLRALKGLIGLLPWSRQSEARQLPRDYVMKPSRSGKPAIAENSVSGENWD